MRRLVLTLLVLFAAFAVLPQKTIAAGTCLEGCKMWCDHNRPNGSCYSACVGRPSCLTGGPERIRGNACRTWCHQNKPGDFSCLGDCAARDARYGPPQYNKRH